MSAERICLEPVKQLRRHGVLFVAIAAILLSVLWLFAPSAWAQSAEAQRQLDFAREELQAGEYDRALKSADSAMKLDPAAYEGFLIKALAYEGKGRLKYAESMLYAYLEVTKGVDTGFEATDAMLRIQQAIEQKNAEVEEVEEDEEDEGSEPAVPTAPESDQTSTSSAPSAALAATTEQSSPAPSAPEPKELSEEQRYRQAVELVTNQQCDQAHGTVYRLIDEAPDNPEYHRLLADVELCLKRARSAVYAYRKSQSLGAKAQAGDKQFSDLRASLGQITVRMRRRSVWPSWPQLSLKAGGERIFAEQTGRYTKFVDVPPGMPIELLVSGLGFLHETSEVKQLKAREHRRMDLWPTRLGTTELSVENHGDDSLRTWFETQDGETELSPGEREEVTAGKATAVIQSDQGTLQAPLNLKSGAKFSFDPLPWRPAVLQLDGVPTGTRLRVMLDGLISLDKSVQVPVESAELDPVTGIMVGKARIDSLPAGSGALIFDHPQLGMQTTEIEVQAGQLLSPDLDWRSLDHAVRVTSAWHQYQDDKQKALKTPVIVAASATIATGVATIALFAGKQPAAGIMLSLVTTGGVITTTLFAKRAKQGTYGIDDWDPNSVPARISATDNQ